MSVTIDMHQVAGDAARQLGALNGETTLELVATRAANTKLTERVAELEKENGQLRQASELLQQRIAELEHPAAETLTD